MVDSWERSRRALQGETEEYHGMLKAVFKDNNEKQRRADIKSILEPKKAVKRKITTVKLTLKNEGNSKAENVAVSILPSKDFDIVGPNERRLKISPGDSKTVEFFIKVKFEPDLMGSALEGTPVRVQGNITFDDAEKEGKTQPFADYITVLSEKAFIKIKNPYIPGIPLKTPEMFYGRRTLLRDIETDLRLTGNPHVLILHGQRRIGKTSILYQLKIRLKNDFVVILDLQGIPSGTAFYYWIAYEIWKELSRRNIMVPKPDERKFLCNPALHFRDVFLQKVIQHLNHGTLILMFDEFEAIHDRIREEKIDRDILAFIQNLMHNVYLIFSGTYLLEDMKSDWLTLFNNSLHHKIRFLEKHEAEALIREPVKDCIEYDHLSVEKILEMTGGHPYFVQLVCYHLVNHLKKKRKNDVTIDDVNEVLDTVVTAGNAHVEHLLDGMDRTERIVLLALAHVLSLQKLSKASDIVVYLQKYSFEITEQKVKSILGKFLNEEIIEQTANHYQFNIGLIKLWCENKVIQWRWGNE